MRTHAWRITLKDLPDEGRAWDVAIPAADMADAARGRVEPLADMLGDLAFTGEIRRRGEVWRLEGRWRVALRRTCDRCLEPFDWRIEGAFERNYRLEGAVEDAFDEEALAWPGEVDLVDVLREEVWLAWHPQAVCAPDCKGLCPRCGANRNRGDCGCADDAPDHPFAALKALVQ